MSKILGNIKKALGLQPTPKMVKPDVILSAGSQILRSLKPHAPMIKFRAGNDAHSTTVQVASSSPSPVALPLKPAAAQPRVALADLELPHRYRRRPISEEEIAYINRGGPE